MVLLSQRRDYDGHKLCRTDTPVCTDRPYDSRHGRDNLVLSDSLGTGKKMPVLLCFYVLYKVLIGGGFFAREGPQREGGETHG